MSESANRRNKKSWQRILYERQPYKDNYVDKKKFFEDLNLSPYESSTVSASRKYVFVSASIVLQQFMVVSFFLAVYKYISYFMITKSVLFAINTTFLLLGGLLYIILKDNVVSVGKLMHTTLLFGGCLRIIAPGDDFRIS